MFLTESEISDELYKIDDAMKAGFGWENGPFEIWDAIGVECNYESGRSEPAAWVNEMLAGNKSFYTVDGALILQHSYKSTNKIPSR
jgi:3-hydroxyacyl-CoA dehydrogenase